MAPFALRDRLTIDVRRIGAAREPVLVIDDVMARAAELVCAAVATRDWQRQPAGGYPGLRAGLPRAYARALIARVDPLLRRELLPPGLALSRFECAFSLVTTPPGALHPAQRLPHVDIADPHRVALVHFLCAESFGGTAFFRQAATGLEQVDASARPRWQAARAAEMASLGAGYPGPDTPGYDRIAEVPARFDRLVAYRSFTLHSGVIADPAALSADPARGRLTATFFLDYRPEAIPPPDR